MQLNSLDILTLLVKSPSDSLNMGAPFQAIVKKGADGLQLRAQNMKIPLPENSGLVPEQRVVVRLTQTAEGVRANVMAVASEGPAAAGASEALPMAEGPASARVVELLQSLYTKPEVGIKFDELVSMLASATGAGYKPEFSLEPLLVLARLLNGELKDFEQLVRVAASAAGSSLEARIAEAISTGDFEKLREFIETDLRSLLIRIKHDPKLTAEVKKRGDLGRFQKSVESAVERLSADSLQNLRGGQQGYRFFEIPFTPAMGFNWAQIHVVSDNGRRLWRDAEDSGIIALDLSTTHLGELWITLNVMGSNCSCRILAPAESLRVFEEAREELADVLKGLGFKYAAVSVAPYDGRREREMMLLMRTFSSVDLCT